MLEQLSGRTHQVYTAIALCSAAGCEQRLSVSDVTFRPLSNAEAQRYWETGEPADKAGGYAVQGLAAVFITRIAGSYSGIMGLPLAETAGLLAQLGWRLGEGTGGSRPEPERADSPDLQPPASSFQPAPRGARA